jgi:chromosome segregation ATPase
LEIGDKEKKIFSLKKKT